MKLILLGAPGAGKGTQAEILSRMCDIPTISTGNILRAAIEEGSELGLVAKDYMDKGSFAPDDIIMSIIKERLVQPDCEKGYILDGVPRNLPQAEAMEAAGIEVDLALFIRIRDEEIITRMAGRRTCPKCGASFHVETRRPKVEGVCDFCGTGLTVRVDDAPETVRERLRIFHEKTEPLREFYSRRGKLKSVDNQPSIEATTEVIVEALGL